MILTDKHRLLGSQAGRYLTPVKASHFSPLEPLLASQVPGQGKAFRARVLSNSPPDFIRDNSRQPAHERLFASALGTSKGPGRKWAALPGIGSHKTPRKMRYKTRAAGLTLNG